MTVLCVMPLRMPASIDGVCGMLALARTTKMLSAGALRDLPLVVEHQRLEAAGHRALDLGEDVVEIVERLEARVELAAG